MTTERTDLVEATGATAVGGEPIATVEEAAELAGRSSGGTRPRVEPGTICLFSDVVCGWATVTLSRFRRARSELDPDARVRIDHRPFLLEDLNRSAVPKRSLDAQIPVLGSLEPDLGWSEWQGPPHTWPASSLLANEAVQAAKRQGLAAAEELDWALRMAFFRDSVCIALHHEVEAVARACPSVDADRLMGDLERGTARAVVWAEHRDHREVVEGSPHVFLADGSDAHNPGVEFHWNGDPGRGFPVIDADDPSAVADLLERSLRVLS